jgi:hypothetical protein
MPTTVEQFTLPEAARNKRPGGVGHVSDAEWDSARRTVDPRDLSAGTGLTRVPEPVPIRQVRMASSPFAYYPGVDLPMAADRATIGHSVLVRLCVDARLPNFDGFASPERSMVFDINDFDESHPGEP